jgi:hypothetical protein
MIQIRSAKWSASSKCYELIITDRFTFKFSIRFQTYARDSVSNPEVGSSKISNFGFVTIAIARESFLFIPPDNSETFFYLCSVNITT